MERQGADSAATTEPTRQRILRAAVSCLAEGGIESFRIARIARLASTSPASVHYHFESRETLLAEAIEIGFNIAGSGSDNAKYGEGTPKERLRRKIEESLPIERRQRREWDLWLELWIRARREPALQAAAASVYGRLHASIRDLIIEGAENGEFEVAEIDETADRLLAMIDGLGLRATLNDPRAPVDRAFKLIWTATTFELGFDAEP